MSIELQTYNQQLDRTGMFVTYVAGLQKRGIGPNMAVVRHRVRRGRKFEDFNLGIDNGLGFGNSDSGFNGFMVHPRMLSNLMTPDGRSIKEEALIPLHAQLITHDHADHYLGIIYTMLHDHNNHIPLIMAPETVRIALIDEAKANGLPEHMVTRYFGSKDVPPSREHFIRLEPYKPIKVEGLEILPICLPHSAYLSLSYLIKAPNGGMYLHLSDFKSDMQIYPNGIDPYGLKSVPELFEHPAVKKFMENGKLGLVGIESTNAQKEETNINEKQCHDYLLKLAQKEKKKRLVCFVLGGNQPRYPTLGSISAQTGRKLEVVGEANKKTVRKLERLNIPWLNVRAISGDMVFNGSKKFKEIYDVDPGATMTIASGPNGEYIANLHTALDERIDKKLKLDPAKDIIVLTATVIPGNEARVLELVGKALRKGFTVHMPPLGHAAKPEHQEMFDELRKMKTLVVNKNLHSSGHDDGQALVNLALACPDNPYFSVIHGNTDQRHSLFEQLLELGRHVVRDLYNGTTVRVPDPRQTARHKLKAIHEFGQDLFLTYERGGGFGTETATRFGAQAVTEEGILLKSLNTMKRMTSKILKVTLEGEMAENVQLVVPANGPIKYDAVKEVTPMRSSKRGMRRPRVTELDNS